MIILTTELMTQCKFKTTRSEKKHFQGCFSCKQTSHYSALVTRIFFKEDQFLPSKRSQLYDTIDFLSACGGPLGLFIGSSILSLIEIVYYVLLRVICQVDDVNDDNNKEREEV